MAKLNIDMDDDLRIDLGRYALEKSKELGRFVSIREIVEKAVRAQLKKKGEK